MNSDNLPDALLRDADVHNLDGQATPDVDVIIGTFNQVDYVSQAIRSVESQIFDGKIRIIIHDDASTDGTRELLLELMDQVSVETALVLQRRNVYAQGLVYRVPLIRFSKACFVANLDGDDYWISRNKLSSQVGALSRDPSMSLSYHPARVVDENGALLRPAKLRHSRRIVCGDELILRNPIASPTVLLRRSAMPNWIDEMSGLDWTLWAAFMSGSRGIEICDLEAAYRQTSASQSNWDGARIQQAMLYDLTVLSQKSSGRISKRWIHSARARDLRRRVEARIGKRASRLFYACVIGPRIGAANIASMIRAMRA